ncbi:furin-like protease 1 isoform X1 [Drosophila serrata]|uniref:furin-like protease 1 isoform X1 n=1 Tax=Drosophila serrata TaxID=7274 RepID=UPI000A1D212C|nr:furin-like protease 1 isoform X1 [Drosophila serrata]XP_020811722.1 furin-like protease 1 isoform X1 [Drosophila serrata]XP_020811723.1 furin-like protease 1 isoform X1 [Drosophila serrata]
MKNDVVRWSRQPTSNSKSSSNSSSSNSSSNSSSRSNISSSHKHKSRRDKLNARQLGQHAARSCQQRATQQEDEQQQTIIECDIGNFNFNFNCNLFKTSFLTQCKPKLSTRRSSSISSSTRHLARTKAALLFILQFSAVVFLCNYNVGFVAGSVASASASVSAPTAPQPPATSAQAGAPPAPAPSSLKLDPSGQSPVLPPYVLDYETGGRAKLTPNSGKYGGSGTSGGNNQIAGHYTHTWAVHIPNGDNGMADAVAKDHGFVNLGKIFDDHYHFAHHKVSKRSLSPATHHQTRLDDDDRVHWAKQQRAKSRSKRDFIRMRPSRTSSRAMSQVDAMPFDDAKWPQMWYLNRGGGLDMNVIPAWKQGITGKGVVVTILDDGLESDHPDIEQNYDRKASYDVNSHDDDPMPHYDMTDSNRHGTRCAGEVAATANNSFCAVGIAYGASVGGVRMLDGDVTDAVEARSLSLNPQHIDIYSASWGPDDDGKTVDGPGELASRAFIEGTTKGRGGKGSIFIWASGNGGREQDNCNCDGYTNSIWTLSISSATEEGHVPWYSEKCSSTLATTYSSGGPGEKQVVTTDLHHSCTVSHTGTSASAPLAAGIAALVLQSNQNLTWRDLQHIVVRTAKPANLKDPSWSRNGVGRRVSHSFGYGLMDAYEMVRVARSWKTVPEQQRCEINAPHVDKVIPPRTHITLQLTVNHCRSVNYLEHVQAKITLTSQRRGDIQLYLRSPANTSVTLLTPRIHDNSRSGFNQWPFMSVHTWGESPRGNWQLEIHNEGRYMAQITQWDMIFYGTETPAQPSDQANPSQANQFNLYGNDMAHNDIEYDSTGQWRNMQQVGDVGMTRDHSNTAACLKWSDRKCLECNDSAYMYEDLCYDVCPQHTYPLDKLAAEEEELENEDETTGPGPVNPYTRPTTDHPSELSNSIDDKQDPLQAEDRRRRRSRRTGSPLIQLSEVPARICAPCDRSCLACYGPLASQCSTCSPGSQLRRILNETFCYAYVVRSTGMATVVDISEEGNPSTLKYMNGTTVLLLLAVVFSVVGLTVAGGIVLYQRRAAARSNELYSRVALIAGEDSDSDNDDELFRAHFPSSTKKNVMEYRDEAPSEAISTDPEANQLVP